jgi:N-acetylglucosaminyl-diphospho-decaprenol L-rhamnosyltransferase
MGQPTGGVTVSIVMVSYNAADELRRTLAAITGPAAPHVSYEILVTDNGSTDDAADVAEQALGTDAVRRLGRNTGFGYAINRTVERSCGDFLLLLNPDACPEPGAIDSLLAHLLAHPSDGIVGGRARNIRGGLEPRTCFGRITPWSLTSWAVGLSVLGRRSRVFSPESLGRWQRDTVRHVDVISGGFLLTSSETWRRLRGFDETYRIYGEDQDLCLRARAIGCRPSITPNAVIVHNVGASSASRVNRDVLVLTGRATVVRQHLGAWRGYGLAVLRFGVAFRSFGERALHRPGRWTAVWRRRAEWAEGWRPDMPMPVFAGTDAA